MRWTKTLLHQRTPVWLLLSELWLDTELDAADLARIAAGLRQSPYTPDQLQRIALYEVAPAVRANLHSVAGEWAGFNPVWLRRQIVSHAPDPDGYQHPSLRQRLRAWADARHLHRAGWPVIRAKLLE